MDRLDEIKARLNEVGSHHPDVVVLVAAVEAVLALHIENWDNPGSCGNCEWNFPCPTVTAIRTALGEERQ